MTSKHCCVPGCQSRMGKGNVIFHRFPSCFFGNSGIFKENEKFEAWVEAIGLPASYFFRNIRQHVCSLHFTKDDYTTYGKLKSAYFEHTY